MSYDKIDRFLRCNLNDDDYSEYSAALEEACNYQPPPKTPLTDGEISKAQADCFNWLAEHTGYTGGMGGDTWDKEAGFAVMVACAKAWGITLAGIGTQEPTI